MAGTFSATKRARYLSEFLGMVSFITVIKLSTYADSYGPFTIGLVLCCIIYQYGYISGGHFNPAVTTGILISGGVEGKFEISDYGQIIMYYVSQFLGALLGGLMGCTIGGHEACLVYTSINDNEFDIGQAFAAEFFFTYFLVSVVLHVGINQPNNQFYGLAIGLVLFFAAFSIGSITGAAINPAVWLGTTIPAIIAADPDADGTVQVKYVWVYLCAELSAAVIAALIYRFGYKPAQKNTEFTHSHVQLSQQDNV